MQGLVDLRQKWVSYLEEAERENAPAGVIQMINWFIVDLDRVIESFG